MLGAIEVGGEIRLHQLGVIYGADMSSPETMPMLMGDCVSEVDVVVGGIAVEGSITSVDDHVAQIRCIVVGQSIIGPIDIDATNTDIPTCSQHPLTRGQIVPIIIFLIDIGEPSNRAPFSEDLSEERFPGRLTSKGVVQEGSQITCGCLIRNHSVIRNKTVGEDGGIALHHAVGIGCGSAPAWPGVRHDAVFVSLSPGGFESLHHFDRSTWSETEHGVGTLKLNLPSGTVNQPLTQPGRDSIEGGPLYQVTHLGVTGIGGGGDTFCGRVILRTGVERRRPHKN